MILGLAILATLPLAARADTQSSFPPYPAASQDLKCGITVGTCRPGGGSSAETGYANLDFEVESPGFGLLPGIGDASGGAGIITHLELAAPVPEVRFQTDVHIARASIEDSVFFVTPLNPDYHGAIAYADVNAWIRNEACSSCSWDWQTTPLVSLDGELSVTDVDVTISGVLRNDDGGKVPAGTVEVWVWIGGDASMLGTGRLAVQAEGLIESVTFSY